MFASGLVSFSVILEKYKKYRPSSVALKKIPWFEKLKGIAALLRSILSEALSSSPGEPHWGSRSEKLAGSILAVPKEPILISPLQKKELLQKEPRSHQGSENAVEIKSRKNRSFFIR
jgi:hypothetical protein